MTSKKGETKKKPTRPVSKKKKVVVTPQEMLEKEMKKLRGEIVELREALDRSNTYKRRFAYGIVRGLGVVFGASLVATVGVYTFFKFLQTTGLYKFMESNEFFELIENALRNPGIGG